MSTRSNAPLLWWKREDLGYRKNRLFLGSRQLLEFAHSTKTPVYLYHAARVKENLTRLTQALHKEKIKFQIFYALKANRFLPLVTYLKMQGLWGWTFAPPVSCLWHGRPDLNREKSPVRVHQFRTPTSIA